MKDDDSTPIPGGEMLRVEGLGSGYGSTQVLFDVSLGVPEGGLCCVMGRNGVGKTTLMSTIMGLIRARGGQVVLAGEDITRTEPYERVRAGIAYVPQGRDCFPQLTVMENLRVVAEACPHPEGGAIDEALELFPRVKELLSRPAGFLSGGQMQQLAIARALVARPRLLLLDEPTEGIQPSIILEIEEAIAQLKQSAGLSIVLVEQYVEFAMRLADTYVVMDGGRVVEAGDAGALEDGSLQEMLAV
jgi:urea transport system ATP-binding protein